MYINNTAVNTRFNHPSVSEKTALVTYFFNNGQYQDPVDISSVTIFLASDNFYPSSIIGTDGLISSSVTSQLMTFANSATLTTDPSFDSSGYSAAASGIYKLRDGVFAVVLDPATASNLASAVNDYIDVWTIRRLPGSDFDTIVNEFTLNEDRFYATTEPVLFRVSTRLENKYLTLGSKIDLKFTNEFTIENGGLDSSVRNLFKESLVINPAIEIYKENDDRNLPSRVSVSSFSDTSGACDVTSDSTVVYTFDTNSLSTHPQLLAGNLGSMTGTYVARLKFNALNQVIYSNYQAFIIR